MGALMVELASSSALLDRGARLRHVGGGLDTLACEITSCPPAARLRFSASSSALCASSSDDCETSF
jgi:hypothetical protein